MRKPINYTYLYFFHIIKIECIKMLHHHINYPHHNTEKIGDHFSIIHHLSQIESTVDFFYIPNPL
jgi:hypothetical protein